MCLYLQLPPSLSHIISNHWIFSSRFSLFFSVFWEICFVFAHCTYFVFAATFLMWLCSFRYPHSSVSVAPWVAARQTTEPLSSLTCFIWYYILPCVWVCLFDVHECYYISISMDFYMPYALFLLSLKEMFSILCCCCWCVVLYRCDWYFFFFLHWLLLLPFHSIRIN